MLAVVVAFSTEMLTFHVFKQYFLEVEMRFKHSNLCVCVVEWFNEPPLTWTMWCNQFCPMKSRLCCLDNYTNTIENFDWPAFFFFERREQYNDENSKASSSKKKKEEEKIQLIFTFKLTMMWGIVCMRHFNFVTWLIAIFWPDQNLWWIFVRYSFVSAAVRKCHIIKLFIHLVLFVCIKLICMKWK